MLNVKNLTVEINGKEILKNINFSVKEGETLILFGPNGSGKSTLIRTIMGFSGYTVKKGEIIFKGKKINELPITERVKMGLGVMFQQPPKVRGVKLEQLSKFLTKDQKVIESLAQKLNVSYLLNREINFNFSGGEMKRSELFQLILQNPDLLLLDEPESGVDIENISLMGKILKEFLVSENKSALIITHTGYILDYLPASYGCLLIDGEFFCSGSPSEMFESIKKSGYEGCQKCQHPKKN